jgi:hypothetical protein
VQGTIKLFDKFRYFGFIQLTNEYSEPVCEFFLHGSHVAALLESGAELYPGTLVNFWLGDDERSDRLICVEVELLVSGAPPSRAAASPLPSTQPSMDDAVAVDDAAIRSDIAEIYASEFRRSPRRTGHANPRR